MAEICKATCKIGLGETNFDGSALLKMVLSDQEDFERSANVVLDVETLALLTDKNKELTSSPRNTLSVIKYQRNLSRKESYPGEKIISEREMDHTPKLASYKGSGLNNTPEKCVVVPVSTELSVSGKGSMRWRRYNNKRPPWADPRRILFIFATLSSMGTIILIYFTLTIAKINGDAEAQ